MIIDNNIEVYLEKLNERQQTEEDFYKSSKSICLNKDFYKKVFHKIRSVWLFDEIINKYKLVLTGKVLEIGGGYGVQAAYLKKIKGDKIELYYSDSSVTAVKASDEFELFFDCKIDHKWVIGGENIPAPDDFFDSIYFFASFHYLQDILKTISECYRVLKSDGKLVLMLEPSCPKYLSFFYNLKVKRDEIQESFFTKQDYKNFVKEKFIDYKINYFTNFYNRESKLSLIYYLILSFLPKITLSLFPVSLVVIAKKSNNK